MVNNAVLHSACAAGGCTGLMRILVVGELNPDLVLKDYSAFPELGKEVLAGDIVLTLGSASAICAAGLARLGNTVSFVAKIGADSWGDFCLRCLLDAGVDTASVICDPKVKTGLTVSLTCRRDRALITHLGATAALTAGDIHAAMLEGCDHLHVSSYFLQVGLRQGCRELLRRAHDRGMTTSLDPGFDPSERWGADIHETLTEVDVFLPNEVELSAIGGDSDVATALHHLQNGCTLTVAKLGPKGCAALADGHFVEIPAYAVTPVDTTGAGDTFNAGFLHCWLRGQPLEKAMRFAAVCGALSTLGAGGTAAQPEAAEVENHLQLV
jgi:sugar/nucleoside kinase (ribokinase family)